MFGTPNSFKDDVRYQERFCLDMCDLMTLLFLYRLHVEIPASMGSPILDLYRADIEMFSRKFLCEFYPIYMLLQSVLSNQMTGFLAFSCFYFVSRSWCNMLNCCFKNYNFHFPVYSFPHHFFNFKFYLKYVKWKLLFFWNTGILQIASAFLHKTDTSTDTKLSHLIFIKNWGTI